MSKLKFYDHLLTLAIGFYLPNLMAKITHFAAALACRQSLDVQIWSEQIGL